MVNAELIGNEECFLRSQRQLQISEEDLVSSIKFNLFLWRYETNLLLNNLHEWINMILQINE